MPKLASAEFVEGSFRASASDDDSVIAVWNVDYLSGTGDDRWGFVDLSSASGIAAHPSVGREVFDRSIYVISQRLQGLKIDGAFIHRPWPNGAHTCIAGRGSDARQFSVAYFERDAVDRGTAIHSIVITGPDDDHTRLSKRAASQSRELDQLLHTARLLYERGRKKLSLPHSEFSRLRQVLAAFFRPEASDDEFAAVSVSVGAHQVPGRDAQKTAGWTFEQWTATDSPLSAVLAEQYWFPVLEELRESDLPLQVLEERGDRQVSAEKFVVVSRPAHIGGQEFDAVVLVGTEQGLFPPRVLDNDALAAAVEQQSLRELYISITRARYQVVVALAHDAILTPTLQEAAKAELLQT